MNKELDRKLRKKLDAEKHKNRLEEIREQHENKYINALFGTLIPLYLLFFGAMYIFSFFFGVAFHMLGIGIAWIFPLFHGAIWAATVISVFRKRSVLESIIQKI